MRQALHENLAGHLINTQEFIQERAIQNFTKADPKYGAGVKAELEKLKKSLGDAKPKL